MIEIDAKDFRNALLQAEREKWELHTLRDIRALGLPEPYKQHPEKDEPACYQYIVPGDDLLKNKPFDFAWPSCRVLVEIDGGTWKTTDYGRSAGHAHPRRINEDNAKRNRARLLGYRVFQFTGDQVESGEMAGVMREVFTKVQVA